VTATSTSSANDELAKKARGLLPILRRQARRPYIVEFAGTPKAGKTTALHVLSRFLKDCGYHVHEMRERASDCPVAMKGHFFFNTWTTTTMLAQMIESLESEVDVLLLDRGVFDAIVWLESQSLDHQVTPEERKVFRDFVLLDRWRTLTDLTFVLKVAPDVALLRENKDLLIPRTGSIMSNDSLSRYNRVLHTVQTSERGAFQFIDIDTTTHTSAQTTTHEIASALVEHMDGWADPEIAVLPKPVVERVFGDKRVRPLAEAIGEVEAALEFRRRSTLDRDENFVGLVGAAVLRHEDKMLLLRRAAENDEKRAAFGEHVLWKGCHITRSLEGADLLSTAVAGLKARLREDFHLARIESEPTPRFLVWNHSDLKDARHLGIIFDLTIPAPEVAQSLANKVFKRERTRTKLGRNEFISPLELQTRVDAHGVNLESWSVEVLRYTLAESR
jgi:predicted NUDIX family phosphoesterase/thymidylate kinase